MLWLKRTFLEWGSLLFLVLLSSLIGLVVAGAEAAFAWGMRFCILIHQEYPIWTYALMPVLGLIIVFLIRYYGGLSQKGMNVVFEVSQGLTPRIPKRTLFLVTFCTWLSHLAGASVGREGVAVQIGATLSDLFRNLLPVYQKARNTFLVIGMAAGFAGLFGTPFTASFFALEVLTAGKLELEALLPAMAASFTASGMAAVLGVYPESFPLEISSFFQIEEVGWKLVVLGIAFGLAGSLFAWGLHEAKHWIDRFFPNPMKRVFLLGIPLALVMYFWGNGRYGNTGINLMEAAFEGGVLYPWDFLGKYLLTIWGLSIGFMGGEVTPLFTIGCTLGYFLAVPLGLEPVLGAALGYAAVFGAGTNTWLASIMVGMELFGYRFFPFFFVTCSVAYFLNRNRSIYTLQRNLYEKDLEPLRLDQSPTLDFDVLFDNSTDSIKSRIRQDMEAEKKTQGKRKD